MAESARLGKDPFL